MASVIKDDMDWAAYERSTDCAVKVRKAADWEADLAAEFATEDGASPHPTVKSTKLGGLLHFLPGEITVWAGYSGHRKSMFTGQVVLDLIDAKQRVLVASMEMMPARTLSRMARQATSERYPSQRKQQAFMRWTDDQLWIFDHMGRLDPSKMVAVSRYFAEELRGQHVVIDSMMMVCASEEHLDEQKQFATDVVRLAQETGMHFHIVAHCRKPSAGDGTPPTKYDVRGSAAITDQAHNVVTIWANKAKQKKLDKDPHDMQTLDEFDAVISVEKQRSGAWEGQAGLFFASSSMRFSDRRQQPLAPYIREAS